MGRKKWKTRIIVIAIILIAVAAILRINIEPADYNKKILEKVDEAVELYQAAEEGNENGQYSWYAKSMLKARVLEAKALAEDPNTVYEDSKAEYKAFCEVIDSFKKQANQKALSEEQKAELPAGTLTVSEKTESDLAVELSFVGDASGNDISVNTEVHEDTPWAGTVEELTKDLGCEKKVLSFAQNGSFPGHVTVSVSWAPEQESKDLQIYAYDYQTKSFGTLIRGEIDYDADVTTFTITEGGTYVLLDRAFAMDKLSDHVSTGTNGSKEEASVSGETKGETEEASGETKEDTTETKEAGETSGETAGETKAEESAASGETKAPENETTAAAETKAPEGNEGGNGSGSSGDFWEDEELWDGEAGNGGSQTGYDITVTVEIRCDSITDTSKLTNKGVAAYVPADGTILAKTEVQAKSGESVFDVFQRTCRNQGIQLEFRSDALYSGAYIEGINHIYEYDAGSASGWMFKVNGWFPNYGCGNYLVSNGDEIMWVYTCDLGKDVGNPYDN